MCTHVIRLHALMPQPQHTQHGDAHAAHFLYCALRWSQAASQSASLLKFSSFMIIRGSRVRPTNNILPATCLHKCFYPRS